MGSVNACNDEDLAAGQHLVEAVPYLMGAAMLLAGLALWIVDHSEGRVRIANHVD